MKLGQGLQHRPLGAAQVASGFKVFGQALGLVQRPSLEGVHELSLVDDAVLKREQSEKQMAVRSNPRHRESPGQNVASGRSDHRRRA